MKPPASARVGPAVLKDAQMGLLVAAATDRASQGMTEGMVGGNRKGLPRNRERSSSIAPKPLALEQNQICAQHHYQCDSFVHF